MVEVEVAPPLPQASSRFLSIPVELIEAVVVEDARLAATLSQTCRYLRYIVYGRADSHIWRTLYLSQFDDPRKSKQDAFDWPGATQNLHQAVQVIAATRGCGHLPDGVSDDDLSSAYRTCFNLLLTASASLENGTSSANSFFSTPTSKNLQWLVREVGEYAVHAWPWLAKSETFDGAKSSLPVSPTSQEAGTTMPVETTYLAGQHGRWGVARMTGHKYEPPEDLYSHGVEATRALARSFVYHMRNYSDRTSWGPFERERDHVELGLRKTVDWEDEPPFYTNWNHAWALLVVLLCNINDAVRTQTLPRSHVPKVDFINTRPFSAPGWDQREDNDWAGIEGDWKRIICFMDYRDLEQYNWGNSAREGEPADISMFKNRHFGEATRVLKLQLNITKMGDRQSAVDPSRPDIYFEGKSQGGQHNESTVEGVIKVTPTGDVKMQLVSVFGGVHRWQSNGVQIGAVGSAFGFVGNWSSADHEPRDPCGPFWMFKPAELVEADDAHFGQDHALTGVNILELLAGIPVDLEVLLQHLGQHGVNINVEGDDDDGDENEDEDLGVD